MQKYLKGGASSSQKAIRDNETTLQSLSKMSTTTDRKSKMAIMRVDLSSAMEKYCALMEHQGLYRTGTFIFSISKIINVKVTSLKQDVESLYNSFNGKTVYNINSRPVERSVQKSKTKKREEGQKDLLQFFNTTASTFSIRSDQSSMQKQRLMALNSEHPSLQKSNSKINILDESLQSLSGGKKVQIAGLLDKQDTDQIEERVELFSREGLEIGHITDMAFQEQQ